MVDAGTIFFTKQDALRFMKSQSSTPSQDFKVKKQMMKVRGINEMVFLVTPNRSGPTFRNPFQTGVKGVLKGMSFKDQFDINVIQKRKARGESLQKGNAFDVSPSRFNELRKRGLI